MKDLLIECRTALGLAKSMAERERYDTDIYTKRIEMIDKALRKLAVSVNEVKLICEHHCGMESCGYKHKDVFTCKHLRNCDMCGN